MILRSFRLVLDESENMKNIKRRKIVDLLLLLRIPEKPEEQIFVVV